MRVLPFALLGLAASLSACASQPKQLASCPVLTPLQRLEASDLALEKVFGVSPGGYHRYSDGPDTTDAAGNVVLTFKQISPARGPQAEDGQGGRMRLVLQPCTAKVISYQRL